MPAYPKLATAPQTLPGPSTVDDSRALPAEIHPYADGRALLILGGQPAGIYANEAAAETAVVTFRRMGVAL